MQPLNGRSVIVHLKNVGVAALRVTGVYCTPASHATEMRVWVLASKESRKVIEGREIGHILGGDFNRPMWSVEYEKWIGTFGIWTLTDPTVGTFGSGSSLGKFLLVLGDEVPAGFPREGAAEEEDMGTGHYIPWTVGPDEVAGYHHPVSLGLYCE